MRVLKDYRLLLVIYGIALVVGAREYRLARAGAPVSCPGGCEASAASCFAIEARAAPVSDSVFWREHARMLDVLVRVNPDDPDTHVARGIQALADGDMEEFVQRFEAALSSGVKHNPLLLQYYAQVLLDRGADWQLMNLSVNRWRENHPFSKERLSLQLGEGPRSAADSAALSAALSRISWLADARVETHGDGAEDRWRLELAFRPGRTVDLREAVAAVTVLSIPEDRRALYEVSCHTLQDCSATLRRP
jgi:hypothetical protein